jgi:hypothetical protein
VPPIDQVGAWFMAAFFRPHSVNELYESIHTN